MTHISASQISCIQRCDREYLFKYVMGMKEETSNAMFVGTAFHDVVDDPGLLDKRTFPMLDETKYPHKAVLRKMVAAHTEATKMFYPVTTKEMKIAPKVEGIEVLGFIDAIRSHSNGDWWMSERKTAGRIDPTKQYLLRNEIQVAGYIAARDEIVKQAHFDPAKFQGMTYETAEKPQQRMGKNETPEMYGNRATCKAVVWIVPATEYVHCKKIFYAAVTWAHERRTKIANTFDSTHDIYRIPGNTAACTRFGNKCSFFKTCHGGDVVDFNSNPEEEESA